MLGTKGEAASRAATIPLVSITIMIAAKVVVGIVTGSISVLADAFDSMGDLLAAVVSFISLRLASKPPDVGHPYGHGKAENISATIEAVIIFAAGVYVIYQGILKLLFGTKLDLLEVGIAVMGASALANFFLRRYLFRVAQSTGSLALDASARHRSVDLYTSVAIMAGLVAVRYTGLTVLDPIIALGIGLLVLKAGVDVYRKSFGGLLDERLPQAEEAVIVASIQEHIKDSVTFHELRTRKAGRIPYVELHLVMSKDVSLEQAHAMCDHLEADIKSRIPNAVITIHCEPREGESTTP
ncbi:MAG: cation transporter [Chloroflexi bacterium]|nr:cation transporter [Chloroflexota bacterium]